MKERFTVEFLQEAAEFLNDLEPKAREKIYYNIRKSQRVNDAELFKKLNEHIWEFRTLYNGQQYRLFAFWANTGSTPALVIASHGIVKKHAKTPRGDIEKAEQLMKQYEKNK